MDRSREDLVQNMVESDLEWLSLIRQVGLVHQLVGGGFLQEACKGAEHLVGGWQYWFSV